MSDLRTRIAKVLWKTFQNTPPIEATDEDWESWWTQGGDQEQKFYYMQADAVIAELGLRQETVYAWKNGRSRATGIRYVTPWRTEWRVDE